VKVVVGGGGINPEQEFTGQVQAPELASITECGLTRCLTRIKYSGEEKGVAMKRNEVK
jgi:hypothetical protein